MAISVKKLIKISLVASLAGLGGNGLMAASFDCAKASTATEKAICKDKYLSSIDSTMGRLYREIKAKKINMYQRDWIKNRNKECGGNTACLEKWTKNRIINFQNELKRPANERPKPHKSPNDKYVFSPGQGIICDKKSNFCADKHGISFGLTKEYLGQKAVEKFKKMIEGIENMDMKTYTLSNGLSCDSNKKICKKSKWDDKADKHWTQVLFGN
jgi:uncharacterized protein